MNKETPKEFAERVANEVRIDIDIEYCKKHNIKFDDKEELTEDELWARLVDSKRTKSIFDYLTKNK